MDDIIKVTFKSTSTPYTALKWLNALPPLAAFDFEAACIYSPDEQKQFAKMALDDTYSKQDRRTLHSMSKASALSHPSHVHLTHLSVGLSETEAFVIILHNNHMRRLILKWLIETDVIQVWHNATFDFKHIYYHTGQFPRNYEDSQQHAKTIINHVETYKAKTGLKDLAGPHYGEWAVAADYFTLDQMYNPKLIEYAAIDGAATMWLWNSIQRHLKEQQ